MRYDLEELLEYANTVKVMGAKFANDPRGRQLKGSNINKLWVENPLEEK